MWDEWYGAWASRTGMRVATLFARGMIHSTLSAFLAGQTVRTIRGKFVLLLCMRLFKTSLRSFDIFWMFGSFVSPLRVWETIDFVIDIPYVRCLKDILKYCYLIIRFFKDTENYMFAEFKLNKNLYIRNTRKLKKISLNLIPRIYIPNKNPLFINIINHITRSHTFMHTFMGKLKMRNCVECV